MSLFQCSDCGCCENTALCGYWWRSAEGKPALCSACDPEIAAWHGAFDRVYLPKGMFKTASNGNLEHVETRDQDFRKYAVDPPARGEEGR